MKKEKNKFICWDQKNLILKREKLKLYAQVGMCTVHLTLPAMSKERELKVQKIGHQDRSGAILRKIGEHNMTLTRNRDSLGKPVKRASAGENQAKFWRKADASHSILLYISLDDTTLKQFLWVLPFTWCEVIRCSACQSFQSKFFFRSVLPHRSFGHRCGDRGRANPTKFLIYFVIC